MSEIQSGLYDVNESKTPQHNRLPFHCLCEQESGGDCGGLEALFVQLPPIFVCPRMFDFDLCHPLKLLSQAF